MTTTLLLLIIASLTIMLVSLAGVVFLWQALKRFLEGNLHYLVSFAAGVFLIVSITLGQEALALAPTITVGVVSIGVGLILMHAINLIFPESHHHHEHSCENCGRDHSTNEARRILASDAVHNIGDGIMLSAAFLASVQLGIITTIGILIHEAVQEISEFFVLKEAGYSTRQALTRNFSISATILIGVAGGLILTGSTTITAILLGIASGGFLYVVVLDLFPTSFRHMQAKGSMWKFAASALLGALLIVSLNIVSNHDSEDSNSFNRGDNQNRDESTLL